MRLFGDILKKTTVSSQNLILKRKDWMIWIEINKDKKIIDREYSSYFIVSGFETYIRVLTVSDIMADDWETKKLLTFKEKYPKGILCKIQDINKEKYYALIVDKIKNKSNGIFYFIDENGKSYLETFVRPFQPLITYFA